MKKKKKNIIIKDYKNEDVSHFETVPITTVLLGCVWKCLFV